MAEATNVTQQKGRWQFQGLFSDMWTVEAEVDWGSLNSNTSESASIAVPGLNPVTDFVLSFNREDDYTEHAMIEVAHIHTDYIHLLTHNTGGSPFNAPSTKYRFVVVRISV